MNPNYRSRMGYELEELIVFTELLSRLVVQTAMEANCGAVHQKSTR